GLEWNSGSADGTGSAARFDYPQGVAVDSAGNVFVADAGNHTIRRVTPAGVVTTLAGSVGAWGNADGTGSAAQFFGPRGVAVDSAGNVFVAEIGNHTIRKVTPAGVVTTLAGDAGGLGPGGSADGMGSVARFNSPFGVAVDSAGNVFVADTYNHSIRKVTPEGAVTTIGGVAGVAAGADGIGSSATFSEPKGIAVDNMGNLYVADRGNNRISKGTSLAASSPPTITLGYDGTHLRLSWPAAYLGWELEAQTNALSVGLDPNWFPVHGSATNTQLSIPIGSANPSVFYRLHSE
ncbi:MAG: hypothetical protein AAB676_01290, partial [Verrucomicrobiota bacterium]